MDGEVKKRKRKGERKDKRIQITYTDGVRPDGHPNRISFYGRTRTEALEKRERYKREKEQGLAHGERATTVNDWIARWQEAYSVNVSDYAPYINRLKKDLGKKPIRSVSEADLVQSLSAYAGMSSSSALKYRMILKQIFHKAKKNQLIPEDPAEDLPLPDDVTTGTHRALAPWESECILNNWSVYHAGRWAMLMLLCGLRRGEMVALDWDAIDLESRKLTVKASASMRGSVTTVKDRTKTKAGARILPICEPLYQMLVQVPPEERTGPVCRSAKGERITQSSVDRCWKTYCNMMTRILNGEEPDQRGRRRDCVGDKYRSSSDDDGGERIVFSCLPHDLRHTYATALYDAGVDIKSAQYYLGHDDVNMTINLYTHLSKIKENEARSSLVNYLDKWLDKHLLPVKN
jgi:integrase